MAQDQFQYIRMPDGSYGKFKADATTEQIRAAVLKDFPTAYAKGQPIADTTTIGPKKTFSNITPKAPSPGISGMLADKLGLTEAENAGSQLFNASNPIESYNAQGRAENPALSRLGDITRTLKEVLFGGQSAGKFMGTKSGLVNNPVTSSMALAPGMAESLANITKLFNAKNQLLARMLRGPGAVGDIEGLPAAVRRELEPRIPRNMPPEAKSEMYNELGEARLRRGAEQEGIEKAQQLTTRKSELTARKQLESVDKMIKEEIEKHRGFAEGTPGPSKSLSESPYATQAKETARLEAAERQPVPLSESPYATQQAEARRFAEGKGGASNPLSSSPNRPSAVEGEAGAAGGVSQGGTPGGGQDLISRTRALVKPGEPPSAADLKRAGDLTQAPIGRLRTLQKFGDKLAENEINRRLQNTALGAVGPLTAAVPHLANDGSVRYAGTSTQQISPMQGFGVQGANIESPSGKKISYFASAGSPKPPKSGTLGEMAYDDKKGNILAWNGSKWVEADDANRQEIRTKISDERAHLVGEYYTGGHLTKDQVMIFAKQGLIGTKDARRIVSGTKEERAQ